MTSLVIQRLRLHALNAGVPSSIPGQGTRSRMPQLRVHMLQLRPGNFFFLKKIVTSAQHQSFIDFFPLYGICPRLWF